MLKIRRSDFWMAKLYTKEERIEALKLTEEIGATSAAKRLGIIKKVQFMVGELELKNKSGRCRSKSYFVLA